MDKIELVKRNSVEIINEKDLKKTLKKSNPVCYCGYETSGEIHLGHLVTITKLLDLEKAGFKIKILLADWHTYLNQKGNWDFVNDQVKIWKTGFKAAGLSKAEFVVGSSFQRKKEYQDDLFKLASNTTMNRALRSMQKVARDVDQAKVSQVIYPLMQIVDIKHLGVDLVHSGIEQRKIHMMGVEKFKDLSYTVPVFVHTPLIDGLSGPGSKMSSSEPNSFISIRDSDEKIRSKLKKAYCPLGEDNPILQIAQLIVFPRVDKFVISRDDKFGGDLEFTEFNKLEKEFFKKNVHPMDLKKAVGDYLIDIIGPIRKKF